VRTLIHGAAAVALALCAAGVAAQGALENPSPNSAQSGIGQINGWHCSAQRIDVSVDDGPLMRAGSGTPREDTAGVCGRTDTGFSLTFNWNRLPIRCFGCRFHSVRAYADGELFATSRFQVEHFGVEFLTGKSARYLMPNFPEVGRDTILQWDEERQNFSIWFTQSNAMFFPKTYYGAVKAGATNPLCGPYAPARVLKYGTFIVQMSADNMALSAEYSDGSRCSLPAGALLGPQQDDGFVRARFEASQTAACPEFPGGLELSVNGQRLQARTLDQCTTGTVVGAEQ